MPTLINGNGPEDASVMIIGDYPTKDEIREGRALTGTISRLLSTYVNGAGYDFHKCFRSLYIRTPLSVPHARKAREDALKETKGLILPDTFEKILAREILEVNPNVILSLGELSTNYLTGRRNVLKLRGSILPLADSVRMDSGNPSGLKTHIRVIPSIHPRDIYSKWQYNSYVPVDYQRLIDNRTRQDQISDDSLVWIARDAKSLGTWWQERGRKSEFLTVDIETFNGFITCLSFCGDGYEALSVPLIDRTISSADRGLMLRTVSEILRSSIPKVNQNIKYDHHMFEEWGFEVKNIQGDTMLLAHCLFPELPKGLDFLTSIYTNIAYYKDDGRDFNPKQGWDVLYKYNARDSLAAWRIWKEQVKEAKEVGVWDFFEKKVFPLYTYYKKLDDRGIRIDESARASLNVKYGEMLDVRFARLKEITGKPELNFRSPKQMQALIYKELKLPAKYRRDEDGNKVLCTNEETIEELILNNTKVEEIREILWNIIWCRKLYKLLGYVNTPVHLDGRMRTNSKLTGTKSGRTSFSETVDRIWYRNKEGNLWYDSKKKSVRILSKELGLSFQTIPKHGFEIGAQAIGKDLRLMYVASPGYTFIEGDGGQAEARVVAVLAEDYSALDEMERKSFKRNKHGVKDDLHTKTAMLVLGKSFEEVTEADRQDFGKKPRHAGNYDMGPARLSLMAHISFQVATRVLGQFHSTNPKIREVFQTEVRNQVTNKREMTTLHGRKRQFFDKLADKVFKEAFSWYPQAVVSDHTKIDTLPPLIDEFQEDAYFLSESHDSLLFEVREERVPEFATRFKFYEESPMFFNFGSFHRDRELRIPLEVKSGENWYELKEIKL